VGAFKHVGQDDRDTLTIELISDEALKTSEIEGEILRRDSVQCSLRQQFGLDADDANINEAEHGIAEMMADLYGGFADPLTHKTLFKWHKMLMGGGRQIQVIGSYRRIPKPCRS
jgi:Fic family protein